MIIDDDIFDDSRYRANVGIMIVNKNHKIMAGEAFHYPGEWMMPQGGIDISETPKQAMKRELLEETTLEYQATTLLKEHDQWLGYQSSRPLEKEGRVYIGQRQKWFLLQYGGPLPDASQATDREFIRFDWVEPGWLLERTARFRLDIYQSVFSVFETHLPWRMD